MRGRNRSARRPRPGWRELGRPARPGLPQPEGKMAQWGLGGAMTETTGVGASLGEARTERAVIDCDVHVDVPTVEALFPYLPPYWVEHVRQTVFKGPSACTYP